MKREGRLHGMVRTYEIIPSPLNPNSEPRFVNRFGSPPTAGSFTKVTRKPTNHSKFTGKCGLSKCSDCHVHPAGKSKDKAKGNHKLNSACDISSDYKFLTWRVADPRPDGLNVSFGYSGSELLDRLEDEDVDFDEEDL